jgi:hypothetical protein
MSRSPFSLCNSIQAHGAVEVLPLSGNKEKDLPQGLVDAS